MCLKVYQTRGYSRDRKAHARAVRRLVLSELESLAKDGCLSKSPTCAWHQMLLTGIKACNMGDPDPQRRDLGLTLVISILDNAQPTVTTPQTTHPLLTFADVVCVSVLTLLHSCFCNEVTLHNACTRPRQHTPHGNNDAPRNLHMKGDDVNDGESKSIVTSE